MIIGMTNLINLIKSGLKAHATYVKSDPREKACEVYPHPSLSYTTHVRR